MSDVSSRARGSHYHIARQMALVALFIFVGKFAGAGKEMAIAYRYGVGSIVDLYVLVFVVVTWLPSVLASVLNSVFVPLTLSLSVAERKRFNGEISGIVLVGGIGLCMLMIALLPWAFGNFSIVSTETQRSNVTSLVLGMAPAMLFSFVVCHYNAQLLAEERHVNTMLDGLPSLCLLIVILCWPGPTSVYPLIIGTLLGTAAHAIVLMMILRSTPAFEWPQFTFLSPAWRAFRSALGIMIVSQIVISVVPMIDHFIVSQLGTGSNSILSYSTRLLALLLGIGATAVGRALLPVLSKIEVSEARYTIALRWFFWLAALGVFVMVIAWWLTPFAVTLIYQRGAFDAANTVAVSETIRFGLLQLPFYFSGIVLVQLFAAERLYKQLFISSCIAVLIKILTGYGLTKTFGVPGIMLSTSLMYVGTFCYLLFIAKKFQTLQR